MIGTSVVTGGKVEVLEEADTVPSIKVLDLADTYDSSLDPYQDEEPTVKMPVPIQETRYPGVGLIIALTVGISMWFLPLYYIAVYLIAR